MTGELRVYLRIAAGVADVGRHVAAAAALDAVARAGASLASRPERAATSYVIDAAEVLLRTGRDTLRDVLGLVPAEDLAREHARAERLQEDVRRLEAQLRNLPPDAPAVTKAPAKERPAKERPAKEGAAKEGAAKEGPVKKASAKKAAGSSAAGERAAGPSAAGRTSAGTTGDEAPTIATSPAAVPRPADDTPPRPTSPQAARGAAPRSRVPRPNETEAARSNAVEVQRSDATQDAT